ncbi:DUF4214 domain-containing protein [Roseomonas vastitatis]|uniref:DUF4214 domain-containing protein n=1 Tax=Teichococcus vastitatis TaxID=2307076 RepID=A0ABS9WCQ6_9PROT|nr:DUF4214 domain-containing protein [Pseudoroseomonas vastitatis]MCI0757049.1 DUF4214 domain-containing protein [Pseudoroseomonas vastitatis]
MDRPARPRRHGRRDSGGELPRQRRGAVEGEAAGVQNWVSALDSGALTRAQVLLGFSESAEHQLQTAAALGGETPDTYGITFA